MLSKAILSLTAVATMSYGASETLTTVNKALDQTTTIYASAGGILSADPSVVASAEARMYGAAEQLRPLAENIKSAQF